MSAPDWNQPLTALPDRCEVLVVGAGPAGSACAQWLAHAGRQVLLVDAQAFPRDKTCGDGLVPDTHAALRRLGVLDAVLARAQVLRTARCVGPNGRHVDVDGELAVLPRRELDALLCRAAVEAGATMAAPVQYVGPLLGADGRVTGARLESAGQTRQIACDWLVLATGAAPGALIATGLCQRRIPSGVALRTYVHHADLAEAVNGMRFVWHPRLRGGYGWIFEGQEQVYNIGVGVLSGPRASRKTNLRNLFDQFVAIDPVAARLMREGERRGSGDLKGAPLRCDLDGAAWSAPGVLVTGEAAGATYSFTGEGIGKAMETGLAAAESLLAGGVDAQVMANYAARLAALKPRFEMYRQAASFNRFPWLVNVMIWRANRSAVIRTKLSDILGERRMPGSLLSWRGLRRMLLP
jgi:menaquinone-9 beta-reductase